MKISTNWLNNYVDLSTLDEKSIANKLTMTGTKVESIINESSKLKNIVIGKIISIKKHDNADNLLICQIDIKSKTVQIITSAKNVKQDDLVPVCLDGATTANGIRIKKSKIRGEISEGMMCSLAEIGLSKTDYPYAIDDGIFIIQENCKIGQNVSEAFNLNDTIFDFEITSNRPDCLCAVGIAREISAAFNLPLKFTTPKNYCTQVNSPKCFPVEMQSNNCLRYMAKLIKQVQIQPSPKWLKNRLEKIGIQSVNNLVDITNFVMIELGLPMHVYDLDQLSSNKIIIRQAKNNENVQTLINYTAQLNENDLIICDTEKPLCIAGIIGGKLCSITQKTKNVILEVGCFEKTSIRKTAQKLTIRTEASTRFEKDLNPNCCMQSLNRACELIEQLQIGKIQTETTDIKNFEEKINCIKLEPDKINKLIGIKLSTNEMSNILKRLGFKIENSVITIPFHRTDIKNDADIAEEIARIYGYDKIPSVPQKSTNVTTPNKLWSIKQKIKNVLNTLGCDETYNYSFSNIQELKKLELNYQQELQQAIEIKNPFGEETQFLKLSTIPSMLNNLILNLKNKQNYAWLFEIGKIYKFNNNTPIEDEVITIALYGNECNFFTLKGIISALFHELRIKNYSFNQISKMPFHDYSCSEIVKNKIKLGEVGELHPKICQNFKINQKIFIALLNLNSILKFANDNITFKPISKFPDHSFDLTLVCDENLSCSSIENEIKKTIGKIFKSCNVFSVWRDKSLGENLKSISFNIKIQSNDHELQKNEIDSTMNSVIKNLNKIGAKLRQ